MYIWLGYETPLNEYTRTKPVPLILDVTPKMLRTDDLFVALEVFPIDGRMFDLKILTAKGDIGYLFRWYIEGVPARVILSAYDIR